MKQFAISEKEAGQRMDKYLCKVLNLAPRGFIYKMLRKKNIVLNDKKASGSEILKAQDIVKIYLSDETFAKFASSLPGNGGDCDSFSVFGQGKENEIGLKHGKSRRGAFSERESEEKSVPDAKKGKSVTHAREEKPLQVVYEDADILVINKPAGMLSQKAKPEDVSANECVIGYLLESGQLMQDELRTFRPSICNRLDRNTSGLLVTGKSMRGLQEMAELLKTRKVKKFYRALVVGIVSEPCHLTGYLTKNHRTNQVEIRPGDESAQDQRIENVANRAGNQRDGIGDYIETSYVPVAYFGGGTLLEVHLITGRSHQIRAHLSSVGHPVLGDPKYGNRKINHRLQKETGIRRQLLHAYRMEFPDGRIVTAKLPEDFRLAEEWMKSFEG